MDPCHFAHKAAAYSMTSSWLREPAPHRSVTLSFSAFMEMLGLKFDRANANARSFWDVATTKPTHRCSAACSSAG